LHHLDGEHGIACGGAGEQAVASLLIAPGPKPVGMCMCLEFQWLSRAALLHAQQTEARGSTGGAGAEGDGDGGGGENGSGKRRQALVDPSATADPRGGPLPDDHSLVLLAGYEDGSTILWDVATLKLLHRASRHTEPMLCVAMDPTRGLLAVSGSAGSELCVAPVWPAVASLKVQSRSKQVTLKHPGINAVTLRSDFKLVATAGWDNRVRLFSWPKMTPLAILESHTAAINFLVWSAPLPAFNFMQLLAACSKDNRISLWNVYNN